MAKEELSPLMNAKFRNIFILLFYFLVFEEVNFVQAKTTQDNIVDSKIIQQIMEKQKFSNEDFETYKKLFLAVGNNNINQQNTLNKKLKSNLFMGHVLAEKYLSKGYRSSYTELEKWLREYNTYPQRHRIYKLAKRKAPKGRAIPKVAPRIVLPHKPSGYSWYIDTYSELSPANRKYVKDNVRSFLRNINRGKTKMARDILENKKFISLMPKRRYSAMCATLATVYFIDNHDIFALNWAEKAVAKYDEATGYWFGGLAAWRLNDYEKSAELFDNLSKMDMDDEWMLSAGGYWAYRAHLKLNQPRNAIDALERTTRFNKTFYGILAVYQLKEKTIYNWNNVSYLNNLQSDDLSKIILSSKVLQRAILLAKIGRTDLAEKELTYAYNQMEDQEKEATMFVCEQFGIHAMAIKIANQLTEIDEEMVYDKVSYPIPQWHEKLSSDKALILALIRQESRFSETAQSSAGARGLMQLMPNTAYHVTRNRDLRRNKEPLFDVELNLKIGQKYVEYLMKKPYIEGNLFYLLTAYNAGPGNLVKWRKKVRDDNDPLMFIEAIPARQTRIYIERVMANYWLYNFRMGTESLSLEQIAFGLWPTLD
ncbi:MAG: lytic transglycosylase domain-containing protein [Alphaproteobacteria bacterium]|nr:lytic transglycosylase domain-containing protein [Alphaproteobacteria bacterium]